MRTRLFVSLILIAVLVSVANAASPAPVAAESGMVVTAHRLATEVGVDVLKSGGIHYKHAEILEASARIIGNTAIVLNRIRLDAVVGGNEVTNPFVVTDVYVNQNGRWKLGSLSFTRLMGQ